MHEWDFRAGPRGLRLRICEWGAPEPGRPTTLVLHGYLEQGAAWDAVAGRLPGRIVAPDHRGHGLSDHVGPGGFYHFWDYVADVDALADPLGGPVDVVGHSMGATIALLWASLRPERVRRLALVEGLGMPDESPGLDRPRRFLAAHRDPPRHRALADLDDGVRRMRHFNPKIPIATARALVARVTRPVRPDDPHVEPDRPGTLVWTWDPLHRARNPTAMRRDLLMVHLAALRAPTLLVWGATSPYAAGLPDRAEREAAIADRRVITVDGAGHLVHHDAPDALAAALAAFLG